MMSRLIKYFIKYPAAVYTIMVGMLVFGVVAYMNMNTTFFPVNPSRTITIRAVYPGASPQEVEEGIVQKIEDNLKGVTGVERYTSVSSENSASITVEVLKDNDPDRVLEDVKNAVNQVPSFPTDMEPIVVYKQENLNFCINFALSGEGVDLLTLKEIARGVERDLRNEHGVSKITLNGFPDEEIEIAFDENSLRAYGITFQEAARAVAATNLDITGGTIKGENEEIRIRATGKAYTADQLVNTVVKAQSDGTIVYLKDLATVRDRWNENPNRTEMNGKPSVEVLVQTTDKEDLLTVAAETRQYINQFNADHTNIQATLIRDFSVTLEQRRDLLLNNGVVGMILVLVLLSFFLNIRLAGWVAMGIPMSFLGMFILAQFFGITINVISLFGMIVVVGILVDDGIVIAENIYQHYENGKSLTQAAVDGTLEVVPAVLSAVLTTIVAFSSFFFLDGRLGDFFGDLAFIVIATLLISLFEGLFFLPAHIAHTKLKSPDAKKNRMERIMDSTMNWMRDTIYTPSLAFFLKYRAMALAMFFGLLWITIGAIKGEIVSLTFFPFIERDDITVELNMPAGTREESTQYWLDYIEEKALEANAALTEKNIDTADIIVKIQKSIGPTTYQGKVSVILLDSERRSIRSAEITNALRDAVGPIYQAENLSFGTSNPFGKPISVSLLSTDLEQLEGAKGELKIALEELSQLRDVVDNDKEGVREVNLSLKTKARMLGLTLQDVLGQVRQAFFGFEAQRLQRGEDEVKVWVRLDEKDRSSITQMEELLIRTPNGAAYPLRELASYEIKRGTIAINHLDGQREVRVEADLANPDESAPLILANIRDSIVPPILHKYPDVRASFETGQVREANKAQRSGKIVFPVVFFIMLLLITFTFRSALQTAILIPIIVFSFSGVAFGHWIHDRPLSLFSFLGIVALIGVIVNDSLVLVGKFNQNLEEGMEFDKAVFEAGRQRFRAIFLTTITTVAGLAPLILNKSFQAQFLVPMAISVAYGIAFATTLTLVCLPVSLSYLNDFRRFLHRIWYGEKISKEAVEPAVKAFKNEQEHPDLH
ncbi:efflux RND transporter permease subunit [Phaeocystidibacter marisrubri]|nr:efflux RND transporter permease subunit [Phaeocystidibacter marisrubri]GGH70026.1 multidrug transporter AcrB [Phaeocystidibacter marisrubri]